MSRYRLQSRIRSVLNQQNRKDSPVKLALTVITLIGFFGLATLMASTPASSGGTGVPADRNQVAENSGEQSKPTSADSAAATAPGSKVFDISELDQMPVVRTQKAPVYPAALRKAGVKGEVIVSWVLDEQGNVGGVKIFSSTDHGFDQAAMEAVQQWTFSPGKKDGKPVNVRMSVPIVFSFSP
jgi:TonB family protein